MKKKGKYNADSISWKGRLNDESSTIIGWREPTNPLDEFSREKRKNGFSVLCLIDLMRSFFSFKGVKRVKIVLIKILIRRYVD